MRHIPATTLYIGYARDVCDVTALRRLREAGIVALIDLALNEVPPPISRETIYCRFPLEDGGGNQLFLIRAAIETAASFIRSRVPTLVFCSAGLSRSPAIAAAALSMATGESVQESLALVAGTGPTDIAPGTWGQVLAVMKQLENLRESVSQD